MDVFIIKRHSTVLVECRKIAKKHTHTHTHVLKKVESFTKFAISSWTSCHLDACRIEGESTHFLIEYADSLSTIDRFGCSFSDWRVIVLISDSDKRNLEGFASFFSSTHVQFRLKKNSHLKYVKKIYSPSSLRIE